MNKKSFNIFNQHIHCTCLFKQLLDWTTFSLDVPWQSGRPKFHLTYISYMDIPSPRSSFFHILVIHIILQKTCGNFLITIACSVKTAQGMLNLPSCLKEACLACMLVVDSHFTFNWRWGLDACLNY